MEKKVLLGMSGGVDSSVSAVLLKKQGYSVYGVTMKLWEDNTGRFESGCCNMQASLDAKRVCDILDIPHYTLNFKKEFKDKVIDNFILEYSMSRTPNPCIECNKYLKFGAMYEMAKKLNIQYIATGHYAKVEYSEKYKRYVLKKSSNIKKDQSYVLYSIPKEILPKIIFPLEGYDDKEKVRQIAKDNKLLVANKPDSEDICFIPDGNYKRFLEENSNLKENIGNIVNKDGKILGTHKGLYNFTIGQRKGIGIQYKEPLYVIGFNNIKNELIVGTKKELERKEMYVSVKTRYSSKEEKAIIEKVDYDKIKVTFKNPVLRITPGQSAVFYIDDIVLGGGKII